MSLALRAVVAVALTVVFYVFALVVCVWLVTAPVVQIALGNTPSLAVIVMPAIGATILFHLVPRREPFAAPGALLAPEEQPELAALVEEVARTVGHPVPDATYLDADVNAGVLETRRHRGRRERVLLLGLPLLEVVTVDQLRAILAHEFGHDVAGDARFARRTYRTRAALVRISAMQWSRRGMDPWLVAWVRWPFRLYARLFLRVTGAIARRQELAADALAARVAGTDAQVGALRRTAACGPAFDAFWADEVVPALVRGLRPPLGEGFRAFLSAERIDEAVRRELNTALEQDVHDPYDSHPTLRQRLAALGADPDDDPPSADPPASTLLRDHAKLEAGILRALTGDTIETLPSASWDDVEQDWLRRYAVMVDARRSALAGHRVGDVPALAADPGPLVAALRAAWPDAFAEHADALARELLGAALTVALVRDGFAFDAAPGEPMSCRRGEHGFLPFVDVAEIAERPDRGWVLEYRIVRAGVYDAPLADASVEPVAAVTGAAVERRGPTRPPVEPYRPGKEFAAGAATCFRWLLNLVSGILGLALGTFVVTSVLILVAGPGMIVGYSWAGRAGQVVGGLASLALVGFVAFRIFRNGRAAALRNSARRARENPFLRSGGGR